MTQMNYDECHEKIPNITSVIPAKAGIQSAEIQIHKLNTNKFSDWIPAGVYAREGKCRNDNKR
jgi:hypothetical protein